MILKIAVVEDDKTQQENTVSLLENYAKEHDYVFSFSVFDNAFLFLQEFKKGLFDIVFMDINMPGINGLDASKEMRQIDDSISLIFVTDFAQFAIRGYEVDAYDFMVKPVNQEHLTLKLDRLIPNLEKKKKEKKLKIKTGGGILAVNMDDIVFIEVKSHDTIIHLQDGEHRVSVPLSQLEEVLPPEQFYRSNHCYIVNLKFVTSVEKFEVRMATGEKLQISHPKKKGLLMSMMNYLGESV